MKLFQDYKKHFNIAFLVVAFFLSANFISAQSAEEIRNKINQKDSDIEQLEKEIASYQSQLNVLVEEKSSLSSSLKQLDLTKKKLNADIAVTEKKIDKTNLTIQNLSSDIHTKESSISNHIKTIKIGLKNMNEFEGETLVENILSMNDLNVIWRDIDNVITVREKVRDDILELKQVKGSLEGTRNVNIDAKNELTKLKTQLGDQQKIVIQNTNEKNKLLAQTKNNEANYQKLLKERIAQRDAFEKELRDYEAQLQFILDPSKLPSGRVLSWPLENIFITQLFGKTSSSGRLYASGSHSGVDFRASMGTPVTAMADGTVVGVGDTDQTCPGGSFGKFVFIEYTNGLSSTYGHLSLAKVREGQKVSRGEVVAYSGNTGHSTGPHLHVSLYASEAAEMASKVSIACGGRTYRLPVSPVNAYLDVLKYLPALKS